MPVGDMITWYLYIIMAYHYYLAGSSMSGYTYTQTESTTLTFKIGTHLSLHLNKNLQRSSRSWPSNA